MVMLPTAVMAHDEKSVVRPSVRPRPFVLSIAVRHEVRTELDGPPCLPARVHDISASAEEADMLPA